MVDRCNAVGVRIYADVVINHMCGDGGSGTSVIFISFMHLMYLKTFQNNIC